MMKNERGFTIMELLVVIVIIGVLAAIGVPAYNNMTTRARITACQANQRTLQAGVGMFFVDQGSYPADIKDLEGKEADGENPAIPAYIDNATKIKCPSGKEYTLVDNKVTCTETGHALP